MSGFVATFSSSTASLAISIHAANCPCGQGRRTRWPLEATTVEAARAEVEKTEDADGRGIKVKVAHCARGVRS